MKEGRKPIPIAELRRKKLPVRFSDKELARVHSHASKAGQSLTTWVRKRLGL